MQVSAGKYNLAIARTFIVLTAIIVLLVSYLLYQEKSETYTQLSQQLNKQADRFKKLNDMTELVNHYQERFNRYLPIEQFENEDRLYWLDQLEKIRVKHRIPRLKYTIGSRRPYKFDDGLLTSRGLNVMVSDVKLSMGLLHGGDLINVLEDLNAIKSSRHIVTSCELNRHNLRQAQHSQSNGTNIDATCLVKWFTFKVAS